MPAIKDIQWNYTTSQTGTTIAIPVPANALNDLLIVIITSDTYDATGGFTTSATSQGWTLIHQTLNTALQSMYWKLSSGAEPASYTFTSTDSETYNGCIVSIEDIDTTNPFGNPAVRTTSNQAAAAKFSMPQVTTNVNDSLILYVFSGSSIGVPSLLEGPVVSLLGADGTAESTAVGWGFQPSTGLTSANVVASTVTTGAGVSTTLQIAPPAGGAVIIPTYPAADSSIYIDPLNGTTAFNTNTAVAATADTNYGTSLGGFTAADATITATTDVGINSFHSVPRLTSISGSVNLAGVELVVAAANRPNTAGKNIICHVGPSTEGQLQRFSSVSSGRGIWFGIRSATASGAANTGYKIWQVYGVEKGSLRHQPIVINPSALNWKANSGILDPNVITSFGFWVSGTGVTTTIWDIASLWVLDTTTICGGNAAYPVEITGIALSAAEGKERKSVIKQGSSQAIIYQPLQFGNGGTNPVYVNLDATAIEFPKQYNAATKDVQYNSVDNVAGITYYAGATDTIIHTNAVVSSASRFKFGLHPSSNTLATYNFSGLNVIGAGQISFNKQITIDGAVINDYRSLDLSSATFINGIIQTPPTTNNSLIITTTSNIDYCDIYTNTVSGNNYLTSISDPTVFSYCNFYGSASSGHAIRITSPGTYAFVGNKFNNYGSSNTGFAAIFNDSGGLVTLNVSGGGSTPTYRNGVSSNTVINNTVSLTLTGLIANSDINILQAGTTTQLVEIDQNPDNDYVYSYSYTANTRIDIGVMLAGYVPYYVRGYLLEATDSSLPISQVVDRNFV
jgi:hypothetical protein